MGYAGQNNQDRFVVTHNPNSAPPAGTLNFDCPSGRGALNPSEGVRTMVIPIDMRVLAIFIDHGNTQAVSDQIVTVRRNLADAAPLSIVTIPTTGTTISFTTGLSVPFSPGDLLSLEFDSPVGSTPAVIRSFSLVCEMS